MRPIRFRAWDKRSQVMRDVTVLHFNKDGSVSGIEYWLDNWNLKTISIRDIIVVQYTGLKDKNGVEIYEGDIVRFDARSHCHPEVYAWEYETKGVGIIRYEMGSYVLGGREEAHILESLAGMVMNYEETEMEVIGNIYENKELIDKVKSRNARPF